MEKLRVERIRVVSILLPIFIFLVSVNVSHALVNQQIQATLMVYPSAKVDCKPDTLTIGSSVQWINCFIELEGADMHDINPADVQLTVEGKSGSITADSFKSFGDFDSDGITDIMLRFNRASADSLWFGGITQNTVFTFKLFGLVKEFPFSGTDTILVIKTPTLFARYYQLNAPDIGQAKINWIYGPSWFDYTNYTPDYLHFSGYFSYNTDKSSLFGSTSFYSKGNVKVEKIYHLLLFDLKVIEDQPVTMIATFDKHDDCYANDVTKEVHCKGSGKLIISKDRTGQQYVLNLANLVFDINNYKATLEGGNVWNEVIKVSDITMTHIYAI